MEYKLNPDLNIINWEQLVTLYDKVDWEDRDPAEIRKAFERSSYCYFVYDGDKIVGFGRTVDDGRYYALLADIVVDPDYQGKGLGQKIVTTLKDQLKGYHFKTLTSATLDTDKFYKKLGWKKQSSAFIWPISPKQERGHSESDNPCDDEDKLTE